MKLKCLACDVLARVTYWCAATSPHVVDVSLFERSLHNRPSDLRAMLQREIDVSADKGYDAVVLVYGLCGRGTEGLIARGVPFVLPRAHDCITLLLGSRQGYKEQFEGQPGTYWYAVDHLERSGAGGSSLGIGSGSDADFQASYDQWVKKYGQENANYILEQMGAWQSHYHRAALIDLDLGDSAAAELRARAEAASRGWAFERLAGDRTLIRRLLNAEWDADFLVLPPGKAVAMSFDEDIISPA